MTPAPDLPSLPAPSACQAELEKTIQSLLEDPAYRNHPLHQALESLWNDHVDKIDRLERATGAPERRNSNRPFSERRSVDQRFERLERQIEKVTRISDRYQSMLKDLNEALEVASTRDPLTNLCNRRMMNERCQAEDERSARTGSAYCIAILDVDFFKSINDAHGHDAGDAVLVNLARTLEAKLRDYDLCGRWGGEEFLILFAGSPQSLAIHGAERVLQQIRLMQTSCNEVVIQCTVSIGLAEHRIGERYSDTIHRADEALYRAKHEGRDRIVLAASVDS
ncbi:GGDEF domain-containing protein [Synechococcus sp. RSCCF101]|uniref:biofilm regulation diguanylate cyclase SiaD n=1 Tax=Synechococcus sp. RSCCF101 TaxID=2511069 RepID=UPI001246C383|nr:biofilm regulation diguanylate cyclase SiaD [Synechococcus sp. RSCCF101]QEY31848.1 GGDEF domain-containing protein [Synechococcus sp. RSCCF101]